MFHHWFNSNNPRIMDKNITKTKDMVHIVKYPASINFGTGKIKNSSKKYNQPQDQTSFKKATVTTFT